MAEKNGTSGRDARVGFSLRLKLILTFLAVGVAVSGALSYAVFRILNDSLLRQVQARVLDLAQVGARLVDAQALARISSSLAREPSEAAVSRVEESRDFQKISEELNRVRDVEKKLVRYIYTFAPTSDPNTALYIVDGDVLADKARRARGEETGDISHFSSVFDVSDYPIARRALRQHEPLVENVWSWDPDFKVNSITGYAPLFAPDGRFLGVLGLDMVDTDVRAILSNATTIGLAVIAAALAVTAASSILLGTLFTRGIITLDKVVRTFDEHNLGVRAEVRSRDEVGRLGLSFNAMAGTIQAYSARQAALVAAFGRFVPHELLRLLDKGSILDVKLGDQTQKEMAVLFSDIRSFTALSEKMTPFENFNFLNSYLRRMGPEIRANGGFIDKYIGDAIMALFPRRPDDAIAAAIAMQKKLVEYNEGRVKAGYMPISIGVGVNAGKLMLGTVGEQERMDGSVIADAVNLCQRLEALTRVYGSSILTTGSTLKALGDPRRFSYRFIDRIRVRGRRETVLLFEILDGESDEQRQRRLAYREELSRSLRMYFDRRFEECLAVVKRLRDANPEDRILGIYHRRCENLIALGAPAEWQGVEEIEAK